jgi:hypothetical protein
VLRGIRLRLPAWFRAPYYLILALFFLYPLGLSVLAGQPHSEALQWALFGFSSAAGIVFLSLLPAIRRGPSYVKDNGSPWNWPTYPWILYGLLALAVPARAFLLCWSMHHLPAVESNQLMFGPYFVIPFGVAIAVLLLEIALVAGHRGLLWAALAVPWGLIVLALVGHRHDPIYQQFLQLFTVTLGGNPLYITVVALLCLFAYAMVRRVPQAADMLTVALLALSIISPDFVDPKLRNSISPAPLSAAMALQLLVGWRRREVLRCLFAVEGLVLTVAVLLSDTNLSLNLRAAIVLHLGLVGALAAGAAFNYKAARLIRNVSVFGLFLAVVLVALGTVPRSTEIPE